jgi:hypothetical protein
MTEHDSLDIVELVMAVVGAIPADSTLTDEQRDQWIREIRTRVASGEFGDKDDLDDDAVAALVRRIGPRPRGQAGAAVKPEEPFFE